MAIMAIIRKHATWIVSILYIGVSLGLIVAFQYMPDGASVLGIGPYIEEGNVSDYLTVLSVHFTTVFLVTSLMSTLGAKEELVYHVDIVKRTLLEPIGCNFRNLSIYAFETLAMEVAAFVCRSAYVVLLSAVMGTVIISWMFFKMIGIYFDKDRWREKIAKEIKGKDYDGYVEDLKQLHAVLGRNLEKGKMQPFARNLALLIELKVFYMDADDEEDRRRESAAECILNEVILDRMGSRGGSIFFELYARILDVFIKEEKTQCLGVLNKLFMEYVTANKDIRTSRHSIEVLKKLYDLSEEKPIFQNWISDLRQQVKELEEKDFKAPDDGPWGESRFLEVAREVCQTRFLPIFDGVHVCDQNRLQFYEEIEDLVRCDEKRIGETQGFQYLKSPFGDRFSGLWEGFMEDKMRGGLFVQWFPRYAIEYGGKFPDRLLSEFFDYYCIYAMENGGDPFNYLQWNSFKPQNPEVYVEMCICYLQACAEQVMKGVPGIAEKVAELVAKFWENAKEYKEHVDLPEFYKSSFAHIGALLLYADDSLENRRYNERPEGMLQFMESLVGKIQTFEIEALDMKETFSGFVDTLEKLCSKYYSEEVVREVKGLVGL